MSHDTSVRFDDGSGDGRGGDDAAGTRSHRRRPRRPTICRIRTRPSRDGPSCRRDGPGVRRAPSRSIRMAARSGWASAAAPTRASTGRPTRCRTVPTVLKFDANGNLVTSFGQGMLIFPHGIHVDRDGNVWVTDGQDDAPVPARGAAPGAGAAPAAAARATPGAAARRDQGPSGLQVQPRRQAAA